ncbi:hypothetical protein PsYK624_118120 [Phanerochaete sordida]|uniref:F-box domain-containing protein n=1 Tax=Phanerochaete sordida TaxID=48140 RepID=A0A9P3GIX8_9APHY|nr:hypothetical protein PsYK624_118120 [Phanerochaete sordida]
MAPSLGTCLPDETLNAILVRLHDGGAWDPPPKRGLASCGLVCRHWAQAIRPMLFQRITLRSARDVDELFVLLAAPPLFGRTLRRCIRALHIVEDCTALSRTSWTHRLFLRLRPPSEVYWTLQGAATLAGERALFLSLPRTLPMKTSCVRCVTIAGTRLSLQHLGTILCDLPLERLKLENITFQHQSPDFSPLQRALCRRTSELHFVSATECVTRTASLPLWLKFICLLFAKRARPRVNGLLQAQLIKFINLCTSLHKHGNTIPTLSVNAVWGDIADTMNGRMTPLGYRFVVEGVASATIWTDDWFHNPAHIRQRSFVCPPAAPAALVTLLDELLERMYNPFAELLTTFKKMPDDEIYPLSIIFDSTTPVRELLGGILEQQVFARRMETFLRRIVVELPLHIGYSLEEIMSAPTAVGESDARVVLTTAQRVEWVLRRSRDAGGQWLDRRDEYRQELRAAAQPVGSIEAATLGLVPLGS